MKATHIFASIVATIILMGCQVELVPFEPAVDDTSTSQDTSNASDTVRGDEAVVDTAVVDDAVQVPAQDDVVRDKSLSLSWSAPTERENGEQLFLYDIGGYVIEYRKQTDTSVNIETMTIEATQFTETIEVPNLEDATYEVRVAAFDVNGLYSVFTDYKVIAAN